MITFIDAIERIRAELRSSLTPEQIAYLIEHHTNLAEYDENDAAWIDGGGVAIDPLGSRSPAETAKAHRAMVTLLETLR